MPPSELNEVAEKRLREASPAGRRADGERMHVSHRFGLREKAKQIRDDLPSVANDERRVSKLVNEEWMVQVAGIPRTPEFMQLIENLGIVLVGTDRNFYGDAHRRPAGMVARQNLCGSGSHQTRLQVSVESRSLHAEKQRKDPLPPSRFFNGFRYQDVSPFMLGVKPITRLLEKVARI